VKHWLIREKATGLWWGKRGQEIGYGDREGAIVFHCATQPDLPAFKPKNEEWVDATPRETKMIREWCSYCGQRYVVTWPTLGVTGCPNDCGSLDFGDVGFAVADANAEIFWTAIAHERQAARIDLRRWVVDALNAADDMAALLKKQRFPEVATEDAADDAIAAFEIAMSWKDGDE